jgi:PHS family inorganic phosphate transporter-like MFS transporter
MDETMDAAPGTSVGSAPAPTVSAALNQASLSRFHLRACLTAGMGYFTDAYDLTVISVVLLLLRNQFHPSAGAIALVGSTALLAAFVGAIVFGRVADLVGRKSVYGLEAAIMAAGAVASAFSTSIWWLIGIRFLLGIGIGGDYPVSAVLLAEYANRRDRGRLVTSTNVLFFAGSVAGPILALVLLRTGLSHELVWRLLLGLGALPALVVLYLRRTMPESPRYTAQVEGRAGQAASALSAYSAGRLRFGEVGPERRPRPALRRLAYARFLLLLLGTCGAWFMYDYFVYGTGITQQLLLQSVAPAAGIEELVAIQLILAVVCSGTGALLGLAVVDRVGHRRLVVAAMTGQLLAGAALGAVPGVTHALAGFVALYGLISFFTALAGAGIGVMPAEVYPVESRTTGHGLSAGFGKLGAFVWAELVPLINADLGLRGVMLIGAATSVAGIALLLALVPEGAGRTLEELAAPLDGGEAP